MKIHGQEITAEQQAAGLKAMGKPFKASDITGAMIAAGVPETVVPPGRSGRFGWHAEFCANRAADRLIQQERKKGTITREGANWSARSIPPSDLVSPSRRPRRAP